MESQTLRSLAVLGRSHPTLLADLHITIYDNSPTSSLAQIQPIGGSMPSYVHNSSNPGVAFAYRYALQVALTNGIQWLLLFDQDTTVTAEYLASLQQVLSGPPSLRIAAIVPRLVRDGEVLSPQWVGQWHNRSLPSTFNGPSPRPLTALNTGTCVRTAAFPAVTALPSQFPLDYYDHALFYSLQTTGHLVEVLPAALEHHLSLKRLGAEMTLERYRQVMQAERRFIAATGWGGGQLMYRVRMLKRALQQVLTVQDKRFALRTAGAAVRPHWLSSEAERS